MRAEGMQPILNVSDMHESFDWFERLGWRKLWDWGTPPTFAAVRSGFCELFLCLDGQGGRGRSSLLSTSGPEGSDAAEGGMWISMWVTDVDAVHRECLDAGIEVTHPPTDEPWGVREMHVRHPDGHVFRIGRGVDWVDPKERREPPLPITRVEVPLHLEHRLAALLADLAAHKGMDVNSCLEETLLHSFEPVGGGVASPHTPETLEFIGDLKKKHGIDYDVHASYRFFEE